MSETMTTTKATTATTATSRPTTATTATTRQTKHATVREPADVTLLVASADGVHRVAAVGTPDPDALAAVGGLDGRAVTSLHRGSDALWAMVEGRELHRIDAAGAARVAELDESSGRCVVEHSGTVFIGGADAGLWLLTGPDLVAVPAFDGAPTRERWYTPWGGPPDIFSMASRGEDLYVGVHVGGIMRSSDGGRSWSPTIPLDVDVHEVVIDGRGDLWAATGGAALAHSADRGATWSFLDAGLHAGYALAVAAATDAVVVGVSSGPHADDGALYRFDVEHGRAGRFERCVEGLPVGFDGAVSPRHLVADGNLVAVALPSGDVHVSVDAGVTWARVAQGLRGVSDLVLRVEP